MGLLVAVDPGVGKTCVVVQGGVHVGVTAVLGPAGAGVHVSLLAAAGLVSAEAGVRPSF